VIFDIFIDAQSMKLNTVFVLLQGKKVDSKMTAQVIAPSQAAVDRAAMNVTAGLARNMTAPKTSYEFEATWKGFANDRQSQSRLLKVHIVVPLCIE